MTILSAHVICLCTSCCDDSYILHHLPVRTAGTLGIDNMCTSAGAEEARLGDAESSGNTEGAMQAREAVQRLLEAARDGPLEEFKLAELSFPREELAAVKEGHGRNALHLAALGGQSDICKYLINERHFDVNHFDEQGAQSCIP